MKINVPVQTLECRQELAIITDLPAGPGEGPAEDNKLEFGLLGVIIQSGSPKM